VLARIPSSAFLCQKTEVHVPSRTRYSCRTILFSLPLAFVLCLALSCVHQTAAISCNWATATNFNAGRALWSLLGLGMIWKSSNSQLIEITREDGRGFLTSWFILRGLVYSTPLHNVSVSCTKSERVPYRVTCLEVGFVDVSERHSCGSGGNEALFFF